jgi:hypothetical protein
MFAYILKTERSGHQSCNSQLPRNACPQDQESSPRPCWPVTTAFTWPSIVSPVILRDKEFRVYHSVCKSVHHRIVVSLNLLIPFEASCWSPCPNLFGYRKFIPGLGIIRYPGKRTWVQVVGQGRRAWSRAKTKLILEYPFGRHTRCCLVPLRECTHVPCS